MSSQAVHCTLHCCYYHPFSCRYPQSLFSFMADTCMAICNSYSNKSNLNSVVNVQIVGLIVTGLKYRCSLLVPSVSVCCSSITDLVQCVKNDTINCGGNVKTRFANVTATFLSYNYICNDTRVGPRGCSMLSYFTIISQNYYSVCNWLLKYAVFLWPTLGLSYDANCLLFAQ